MPLPNSNAALKNTALAAVSNRCSLQPFMNDRPLDAQRGHLASARRAFIEGDSRSIVQLALKIATYRAFLDLVAAGA